MSEPQRAGRGERAPTAAGLSDAIALASSEERTSGPRRGHPRVRALSVGGVLVTVVLVALVVVAVVAPPLLEGPAHDQDVLQSYSGLTSEHPLGTDGLGRDVLARTLVGTRLSLGLASLSVLLAAVIGIPAGAALAIVSPRVRRTGAAVIDTSLSVPDVLVAVVIVTVVGVGTKGAVLAVGLASVPYLARVTYILSASIAGRDFVAAARVLGVPRRILLRRYILANIADSMVVTVLALFGECIVAVSALSFLGFGVQAPDIDWGSLLTTGVKDFYLSPAAALAPATMIAITGLALALLADAIARVLNPLVTRGQR